MVNLFYLRFSFSMAMVCMTGTNVNATISDQAIEVCRKCFSWARYCKCPNSVSEYNYDVKRFCPGGICLGSDGCGKLAWVLLLWLRHDPDNWWSHHGQVRNQDDYALRHDNTLGYVSCGAFSCKVRTRHEHTICLKSVSYSTPYTYGLKYQAASRSPPGCSCISRPVVRLCGPLRLQHLLRVDFSTREGYPDGNGFRRHSCGKHHQLPSVELPVHQWI